MQKITRWGILGCGNIAAKVASDMRQVAGASLRAVAARDEERAKGFGRRFGVAKCYGSYEQLAQDPELDVIYVATRHPQHAPATLLGLSHGKAVLCEKPLAMHQGEAKQMVRMAQEKRLFLMEALWTRFNPLIKETLSMIDRGVIGQVRLVQADFGLMADPTKQRLFDKKMGGGSLLDIGIYPLFISLLTLGMPTEVQATATFTDGGVDKSCGMLLRHTNGALSVHTSTLSAATQNEAWIHGSKASIRLQAPFHFPKRLSIVEKGLEQQTLEADYAGFGYGLEIAHVQDCLEQGLSESPLIPHRLSLELTQLLDWVRQRIGLSY